MERKIHARRELKVNEKQVKFLLEVRYKSSKREDEKAIQYDATSAWLEHKLATHSKICRSNDLLIITKATPNSYIGS